MPVLCVVHPLQLQVGEFLHSLGERAAERPQRAEQLGLGRALAGPHEADAGDGPAVPLGREEAR